jgi:hypothetical protein
MMTLKGWDGVVGFVAWNGTFASVIGMGEWLLTPCNKLSIGKEWIREVFSTSLWCSLPIAIG